MFWQILVVLIVFMALLMAGGVYIVRGILYGPRKKIWIGIALLLLCLLFAYAMKFAPGFY
jgi:hypothetical protein